MLKTPGLNLSSPHLVYELNSEGRSGSVTARAEYYSRAPDRGLYVNMSIDSGFVRFTSLDYDCVLFTTSTHR